MISWIQGTALAILDKSVVIQPTNTSVGYELYGTVSLLGSIATGNEVSAWVRSVWKDTGYEFFAFSSLQERMLFDHFISLSGVGPKTALQIISVTPIPHLFQAVKQGDARVFSHVSGVGKKTAEKIIIESRDVFEKLTCHPLFGSYEQTNTHHNHRTDLEEVLVSMGYTPLEARKKIQEYPEAHILSDMSLPDAVREILKHQ